MENKTRLLVADIDFGFRQEIIRTFARFKNFSIVDCISNGVQLVRVAADCPIDIIVSYAYLPFLSGLEAIKIIRRKNPNIKILIYTSTYQADIRDLLRENGISGYCCKLANVIYDTVRIILKGQDQFIESEFNLEIDSNFPDDSYFRIKHLRPIDVRIISEICQGKTNKEIASTVNLSPRTIETYTNQITEKLGLKNRIEIVRFAYLNGVCTLDCNNSKSGVCIKKSGFNY